MKILEKKIGFVTPWFGWDIPGGAEAELRGITGHLSDAGQEIEILSTCVEKFLSDWNVNFHNPGITVENGIPVRRFKVRKRNTKLFDQVNFKLMNNQLPLTKEEEEIYINEMVNSPDLYNYIAEHKDEYSLFVFIPYMFGTTYFGMKECLDKAILIPCLHDESYIHMELFKSLFSQIAGMIFHAKPECDLANEVYNLSKVNAKVLGEGVDTDLEGDAKRFREKYNILEDFILYAGRKDAGKNVHTLIKYFDEYKKRNNNNLKLVLIGGGEIEVPDDCKNEVFDLGFVDIQDKYDAYAAATVLCQPSHNESFSLVIMESWLARRPVLVSEDCDVTASFAKESNGGLWFKDYFDFEGAMNFYLNHVEIANQMGENGRKYVMDNFDWKVIVEKYINYFNLIIG